YLYTREASHDPFRPTPGPGNVAVLEHKYGWRSGYFHLRSSGGVQRRGIVERSGSLGIIGNSGRSRGDHLHFFVVRPDGDYVNPMLVLPKAQDGNEPVVGQLAIFAGGR